jgi:lipopolysaccharide transport system ATP-binding protein
MSDVVIRAEGLGKKYVIGHQVRQERNPTLRDTVARTAKGYLRSAQSMLRGQQLISGDEVEEFWALKDVSFDIRRGDVVGIVGRNGAGKSTLLKVLSRITEPSEGRVEIRGRVASLLEVGTGFHPELTGRENIYLNGAILGMTRAEIKRNFDEIVAFAEIEKFLDTPVKRYSSGMYVRLAFAVAAHLDPEILIVDEVLAVGDAPFQRKCLGKMRDVAGSGRTVLFVSHNLAAMRRLCATGLLLESGTLTSSGGIEAIADRYMQSALALLSIQAEADGTCFTDFQLVDAEGTAVSAAHPDRDVFIEFGMQIASGKDVQAGFTIYSPSDVPLVLCASEFGGATLGQGQSRFRVKLPINLLRPGVYRLEGAIWENDKVYFQSDCLFNFNVLATAARELQGRAAAVHLVSREAWYRIPGSGISSSVAAV